MTAPPSTQGCGGSTQINRLESADQPLPRVDFSELPAPGSGVMGAGHEGGKAKLRLGELLGAWAVCKGD